MIFKGAEVFYNGSFQPLDIEVIGDKITAVAENLSGDDVIDCTGKKIIPGLVEIHSHGCMGFDFSLATEDEIQDMLKYYAAHGITSVLATTITAPIPEAKKSMTTIKSARSNNNKNSRLLGINLEGPFLGADKKGAHDERYLLPLDENLFTQLDELSGKAIRIVDLDPNLAGSVEFTEKFSKDKVISIAHTSCTYATADRAVSAGANHVTHLFNAMNGLHHREPGIVGLVADRDITAEIICDGIHVNPTVIRMMFNLFPEKLALISDSMCACGLTDGEYTLGGLAVTVKGRKATLSDGVIAGSATNVFDCMCSAIEFGVSPEKAILSATLIPAKSINEDSTIGSIAVSKQADLVVITDDFTIEKVYRDGKICG